MQTSIPQHANAVYSNRSPERPTKAPAASFGAIVSAIVSAVVIALGMNLAAAATCPFDTGGSDALNDGVVLTRYALDIRGAPMTASTRYASLDPLQVKNNIECVGCALDMNGDGQIDTVDTTIIARHLAGFSGASLTNGLSLGSAPSASRPTSAAITSFLANGCAVGGAINAFTQGGNAFGAPAVLGTTDGQPLTLGIGGGAGIRIVPSTTVGEPNIIGGHADNAVANTAVRGAFIGGGAWNVVEGSYSVIAGGKFNAIRAGSYGAVGGGESNEVGALYSTIGGGFANQATANYSTASGGRGNYAFGEYSTSPGGFRNTALGVSSFAAGQYAYAADRTFVWNSYDTINNIPSRTDSFRVQAPSGFDVSFGPNRDYFVAFNADTAGFLIVTSTGAKLSTGGVWTNNSDRAKKRDFSPITTQSARDILRKVVALPLSTWSYSAEDAKIRHIGPMAQDFWKAFRLGYDDKTMTDIDARGVTLAAIQGLNQIVKDKDAEIAGLRKAQHELKREMAAIKRKLGM